MDLPRPPARALPTSPAPVSRATTESAAAAAAAVRADVAARLRRVCADMPIEAFEHLVDDICARKRRWAADA